MYGNGTLRGVHSTIFRWKINTYYEYVFIVLGIEHAMHIIILPSVACLAVQYLPTLSHKQLDSRKQLLNIRRVFLFAIQLLSEMEHFSLLEELSEK